MSGSLCGSRMNQDVRVKRTHSVEEYMAVNYTHDFFKTDRRSYTPLLIFQGRGKVRQAPLLSTQKEGRARSLYIFQDRKYHTRPLKKHSDPRLPTRQDTGKVTLSRYHKFQTKAKANVQDQRTDNNELKDIQSWSP